MDIIKQRGFIWIDNLLKSEVTHTKFGSISYLLYGPKPSEHSVNIKMGRFGEYLAKELIQLNPRIIDLRSSAYQ